MTKCFPMSSTVVVAQRSKHRWWSSLRAAEESYSIDKAFALKHGDTIDRK